MPNPRLDSCNEKGHIRALCEPLEKELRGLTVHDLIRVGLHYKDVKVIRRLLSIPTTPNSGKSGC